LVVQVGTDAFGRFRVGTGFRRLKRLPSPAQKRADMSNDRTPLTKARIEKTNRRRPSSASGLQADGRKRAELQGTRIDAAPPTARAIAMHESLGASRRLIK
jgi:hypothetical protein